MAVNNRIDFTIICSLRKKYKDYFDELYSHIVNQSYGNFECIFIVDEDDIDYLENLDDRFRVVRVEEQWLSSKRNIGINESVGDYIIFCDADDYLDINLLKVFKEEINKSNPDILFPRISRDIKSFKSNVSFDSKLYSNNSDVVNFFFSRYIYPFYKGDIFTSDGCWGRAFKRSLLIENNLRFVEEPCRAEDAIFNNDVALKANSLCVFPNYFGYYWRYNKKSEMNSFNSLFFSIVPFGENLKRQLLECNPKYSKNCKWYLFDILYGQINHFILVYLRGKITKKVLISKLKSFIEVGSFCHESIVWKHNSLNKSPQKRFLELILRNEYNKAVDYYLVAIMPFKILKRLFGK